MKKIILTLVCIGICACSGSSQITHEITPPSLNDTVAPLTTQLREYSNDEALITYLRRAQSQATSFVSEGSTGLPAQPTAEASGDRTQTTNNQEAAADEGGLVKAFGKNFMVILRQGKLYTVRLPLLQKSAEITVKAESLDNNAWYDELLLKDNTAIVIGYRWRMGDSTNPTSYWQGSTEINLFKINASSGSLSRAGTYFIESGDYYSERNYSSRLVREKLVIYSPYYGNALLDRTSDQLHFPQLKTLRNGRVESIRPLMTTSDVSIPEDLILSPVLHAMHVCSLGNPEIGQEALSCKSRGVLGSWQSEHYVTGTRFYLWSGRQNIQYGWCGTLSVPSDSVRPPQASSNLLYAFDLEGDGAGVTKVWGNPLDQFSFDETPNGLTLFHYQMRANPTWDYSEEACGERNENYEYRLGHISFTRFTSQASDIHESDYQTLTDDTLKTSPYLLIHRFSENELLVGQYNNLVVFNRTNPVQKTVLDLDPRHGEGPFTLEARCYRTTRIEPAGERFIIASQNENDLNIQALTLGESPHMTSSVSLIGYTEAESRSHGYLFSSLDQSEGLIGLATQAITTSLTSSEPVASDFVTMPNPTSVHILRLKPQGELQVAGHFQSSTPPPTGACETSCTDWYGNTRAIFLDDQIYGLMGDELGLGLLGQEGLEVQRQINLESGGESF